MNERHCSRVLVHEALVRHSQLKATDYAYLEPLAAVVDETKADSRGFVCPEKATPEKLIIFSYYIVEVC